MVLPGVPPPNVMYYFVLILFRKPPRCVRLEDNLNLMHWATVSNAVYLQLPVKKLKINLSLFRLLQCQFNMSWGLLAH